MIIEILPTTMKYEWGSRSALHRILGIPQTERVAELWFGSHPRGPSEILPNLQLAPTLVDSRPKNLRDLIAEDAQNILGNSLLNRFGQELPFLFKLLCSEKALSIQAHPNKTNAELGFERENKAGIDIQAPDRNYRDANHKPECMVALEDFYALSGFRSPKEIARYFDPKVLNLGNFQASNKSAHIFLEEIQAILNGENLKGDDSDSRTKVVTAKILKQFFARIISAEKKVIVTIIEAALRGPCSDGGMNKARTEPWYWVAELNRQFPQDPGCLAALYLRILKLKKGEALFMKAGILHAYLRGTGLEIMANSDNVLRAGCTPKHIDPQELLSILDYNDREPSFVVQNNKGWFTSYVPEFQIALVKLDTNSSKKLRQELALGNRLAIILSLEGQTELRVHISTKVESLLLHPGRALFISQGNDEIVLSAKSKAYLAIASHNSDIVR